MSDHSTCTRSCSDSCPVPLAGQVELPLQLQTSRTIQATAKFAQPVDDGDWICVFCRTFRGISQFGAPCVRCGGYSMSSFQALTVLVHRYDIGWSADDGRCLKPGNVQPEMP